MTLLYEAESYGKIDTYLLTKTTPSVRNLPLSPEGNVVTIYVASHLDQAYCGGIWHLDWSETDQHLILSCICASDIELTYVSTLSSTPEQEQLAAVTDFARWCLLGEWSKQRKDWLYQKIELVKYEEVGDYREKLPRSEIGLGRFNDQLPERIWKLTFHCFSDRETPPIERQVLVCYYHNHGPLCFRMDGLDENYTRMLGHHNRRIERNTWEL